MPIAFISHSSPDDRYVAELEQFVRSLGYDDVFNDVHSIEPGSEFWPRIEEGIRQCDAFVVVLTEASANSDWVTREVEFARAEGKKEIPIWIEECKLPACFDGRDVVDLRPGRRERRKIAASRILRHSPAKLFGRETWFDELDAAWAAHDAVNVYTLVAWGGVGKTSLVAHWIAERMAARGWPGVERYFDWSFYSQGTGESRQTSSDFFIAEALRFFGDPDPTVGSPWERGQRLAELVRKYRTLLVLDGIEPLQYPVNDPSGQAGMLKDQGLESLLQGLATDNPGLCVVTTRETLANLRTFRNSTAPEKKLDSLPREAAIALLRHLQIIGTEYELEAAWQDAGGHALTLQLLGRFIVDAFPDRDIRHRAEVKFEAADLERQGRSAFKVMVAYERWLQSAGPERQRELAILRLTGLFDRPISSDCLAALRNWRISFLSRVFSWRKWKQIADVFGPVTHVDDRGWNIALKRLASINLISLTQEQAAVRDPSSAIILDAHPLVREYFAKQLRDRHPDAFRAAHSRLFDHLCAHTEYRPDTIEELKPLYEAVVHGCLADRQKEACYNVYIERILRGTTPSDFYSTKNLGAIGADLAALAAFFEQPWNRVAQNLWMEQPWLLGEAAFRLRALGRLNEALEVARTSLRLSESARDWENAGATAGNLSELEVMLGRLRDAIADARRAIDFAERSPDVFWRMHFRIFRNMSAYITAADALHQFGEQDGARTLFQQAESLQREREPEFKLLYSVQGFQYSDFVLAPAEFAAWQFQYGTALQSEDRQRNTAATAALAEAERRGMALLEWANSFGSLLDNALGHLTLARMTLYRALLQDSMPLSDFPKLHLAEALNGLRKAGQVNYLTLALLTAALQHHVAGDPDAARRDLDEAQQIAERGPMPLYLADVHLHRARLFGERSELARARTLIESTGYGRRREEFADAEAAAAAW